MVRPVAVAASCSSNGSTNAAVLPVPVCATPMTSRPDRITGMAFAWIGVGSTYPFSFRACESFEPRPSVVNGNYEPRTFSLK